MTKIIVALVLIDVLSLAFVVVTVVVVELLGISWISNSTKDQGGHKANKHNGTKNCKKKP